MKRNFKNHAVLGVCALGLISLNSCQVDDAYDLDKDIDMTITVGGDITVPGSSTDEMMLKDLLEIEEGSTVTTDENGNYMLKQDGGSNSSNIEIPRVSIEATSGFTGVDIDGVSNNTGSSIDIPATNIGIDENIAIDINSDGITSVLKELVYVKTNCVNTSVVIDLNKVGTSNVSATMSDFEVVFPEFMTLETSDSNWEVTDGRVLKLKNSEGQKFSDDLRVPINITKIDFEKAGAEYIFNANAKDNNVIKLNGEIALKGNISLEGSMGSGASAGLRIDVESSEIEVEEVSAVVDPEIDITIDPVEISDLPDFLNDENAAIELTDPRLFFTVTNPSPIAVKFGATLKPIKTGMTLESVDIKDIEIPAGCENYVICIHQNAEMDADVTADSKVTVEDLGNIIKRIPEKIEVENIVVTVPDSPITVQAGKTYEMSTAYEINTPLMFSEGTNIVYTETMDGWGSDLEDVEFNKVEATMSVTNNLPLGVNLTAVAIDNAGNELSNVKVDIDMDIKAGATSDVKFTVSTTNGSIKGLDGLKLTVTAKGSEETKNVSLNENQYIQIKDLKLKLTGGITMDLN